MEEVFEVWCLISVWEDIDAQVLIGFGCVVEGNCYFRVVVSIAVADTDFNR